MIMPGVLLGSTISEHGRIKFKDMKVILEEGRKYILRFNSREEVMTSLKRFCSENQIHAAFFSGIGRCLNLILSYYKLDTKQYDDCPIIEKELEIVSFHGDVSLMGSQVIIHAHGSFSDAALNVVGGHVKQLIVSGTCELFLKKFDGKMQRVYDEGTGLNLLEESEELS